MSRCLGCHDNRKTEGRYALHTFERLLEPGESEELPIVAGQPDASYLLAKLLDADPDLRMPQQDDPLASDDVERIRKWIAEGAEFDGPAATDRLTTLLPPRDHPDSPANYARPVSVFAVSFSPNGELLLTGGWHEVLVWDARSGKLVSRINRMPQRVHVIRFSPDGTALAVGGGAPGEYGEIRLVQFDTKTSKAIGRDKDQVLAVWEDVVLDLTFTKDGKSLLAGGADNSVRAYDLTTGEESWRTTHHADWVTAVDVTDYRFSERHEKNGGLSELFTLHEHDVKSGRHVQQLWRFADGHFVIRQANWELETHLPAGDATDGKTLPPHTLTKITVSGIGKTYKVQRETVSAEALSSHTAVVDHLLQLQTSWPADLPGTEFVVSSSKDRTVKAVRRSDGSLFTTYKGHRREYGPLAGLFRVFGIQAEMNSRRVWSGGEGNHLHGWDPVTIRDEDGTAADMEARFAKEYSTAMIRHDFGQMVFSLRHSDGRLYAASANGQVKQFAIVGEEATFDLNRIGTVRTYEGHADHLFAVDAKNNLVAAAGYNGEVVIWDVDSGEIASRFVAKP